MKLKKYNQIVQKVINSSFPKLKKTNIYTLKFLGFPSSFLVSKEFFGYVIWINIHYQIYDEFELEGVIAHELCHIEEWVDKGNKWRRSNRSLCIKNKEHNAEYERGTDKKVVLEKGYGFHLFKARKKRESKQDKNYNKLKRFYLSSEEIEKLLANLDNEKKNISINE